MDDSETISASLDASKGVHGRKPIRLLLQFHIQTREINAYINWHGCLSPDDTRRITYRFPPEAAQTEAWLVSYDLRDDNGNMEYGITAVREPTLFIDKVFKSEQLVVRLTEKNKAPITAVFDLPSPPSELDQIIAAG
ncbi:hypothetical protein [Candidatus Synechococcus spongiarum]|uniref:hypothetical protein n=1 Tax=Candidatus Synechococcus spongiarum TaxID=431041 RepID=UPI00137895F3|nr:hypothetical protein [Candidatus Synechococcus spongiarum]